MPAVLFGSISTVADTSELQRAAFNKAFQHHDLGWEWDRDTYLTLLDTSGGRSRIAAYADSLNQSVDATAVHATKSRIFQQSAGAAQLTPRPGVVDTIRHAKQTGIKVGLVTTTARDNITALLDALSPQVTLSDFDVVVDVSNVDRPKPDGGAYTYAVQHLGEDPRSCVAIEDNVDGVRAARAAGLVCVAFPNENTEHQNFDNAQGRVDRLDLADLQQRSQGA